MMILMRVIEEKINLKSSLADWRFHNDDEIKKAVITWFILQAAIFYNEEIQRRLLYKCISNGGN